MTRTLFVGHIGKRGVRPGSVGAITALITALMLVLGSGVARAQPADVVGLLGSASGPCTLLNADGTPAEPVDDFHLVQPGNVPDPPGEESRPREHTLFCRGIVTPSVTGKTVHLDGGDIVGSDPSRCKIGELGETDIWKQTINPAGRAILRCHD